MLTLDQVNIDEVFVNEDIQVMLAENETQGSYKNGGKISEGSNLSEVLRNLVQRVIPPVYTQPVYKTTFNLEKYPELGSTIPVEIVSEYTQNDGGGVRLLDIHVDEQVDLRYNMDTPIIKEITLTNEPIVIKARVEFDDGITKNDNFGNPYTFGKVTRAWSPFNTISIKGYRPIFFGGHHSVLPELTSLFIRSNFEKEIMPDYETIDILIDIPAGSKTILFALPESAGELSRIVYVDQGINIIDDFEKVYDIMVADASQLSNHEQYLVYKLELIKPTTETMTIKFIK